MTDPPEVFALTALVTGVVVLRRERGPRCEYYAGRGGEIYMRERA